jgi:hypothetical protein
MTTKGSKPTPPREFKPGTGLHKIWHKYADDGPQAALDYGLKEGLAQSSLLTWLRSWEKREGRVADLKYEKVDKPKREKVAREPKEPKANGKGNGHAKVDKATETAIEKAERRIRARMERDKQPKPPKEKKVKKEGGPITMSSKYQLIEVPYIKDKKRNKVFVITKGPEQSIVRFQHDGTEQCIPNNHLKWPAEAKSK